MAEETIIYIAEDDSDDRELIQLAFQKGGYEAVIHFFDTGYNLIDRLEAINGYDEPSLIVLDYNMPGLDGGETLRRIKENPFISRIPVVIYSTKLSLDLEDKIKADGGLLSLQKGQSIDKLTEQARFFTELVKS